MHKSSVYLPDELKRSLGALAARSGRSEAELIRQAIEGLVAGAGSSAQQEPTPPPPLPRPALVGVGVGPGDPGLVTGRARATLLAADRVVVIATDPRSVGRAEMVVRAVAPTAPVQRVPFAIGGDAHARQASLEGVVTVVVAALDAGELVALAVIGDPTQWSLFPDVAAGVAAQRPGVVVTAEAGITSYQAAAAAAVTPLGRPGGALVVLDDADRLDPHLGHVEDGVVLYKSTTDGSTAKSAAHRHHRRGAVVGELSGLPGQRLVPLDEADDGPISYLATVVYPSTAPRAASVPAGS